MNPLRDIYILSANILTRLKTFGADERFSKILAGSVWALGGQVVATVLGLGASILVARIYGAEMIGILAVMQALLAFTSIFTVLGTNVSILRLIPEHFTKYSVTSAFRVYRQSQYLVAASSVCATALIFFGSEYIALKLFAKPHLSFFFSLAAWVVLFRSLMDLNTQAVRGLGLVKTFSLMRVLPSAAMLIFLVFFVVLNGGPNGPVYSQILAWIVTAAVGVWVINRTFRKRMRSADVVQLLPFRELVRISSPMMVTASMVFVIGQTGVVLLGIFRSDAEVGYYAMAVKLSTLTTFILTAVNTMAAPRFAELFHLNEMDELFYVARKSASLIFYATVPILLILLLLGDPILSLLFGREFSAAYFPMAILVIGQFVSAIAGSTGNFLNMTGNQTVYRNVMLLAGIVNIVLCSVLIPRFGIVGAAFSSMSSLVFWNLIALAYIKARYGRSIAYVPYLGERL